MSLFQELKRRNVIRVGILYLVSSWVLLQLADVLTSLLNAPEAAGTIVVMLLILGFVPALIFAWVYEMTPEGLKREVDVDRTLTAESVFEVQDDIAQAIVEQLGIIMEGDAVAPSHAADTKNINAYELYLEAWQLFVQRRSLPRAIGLFEQAVAADPSFARAWAGLSAIYNVAPGWGYTDRDYLMLANEAAETAIQLNPELSLPYAVLAMHAGLDWPVDYEKALALFDEALARNSKNTTVYLWRTIVLLELGYFDRAEQDALQCLEIDPAYEICRSFLAMAVLFAGDTARAVETHETTLSHGFYGNSMPFLYFYIATGEERTALIGLSADNSGRGINGATAYEYRAFTDPTFDYRAEKSLIDQAYYRAGAAEPDFGPMHPDFLFIYRQYDQLQSSDNPYWWFPYPLDFRNSPHRKRIMREMGLPEYWRKHGFPPQCEPVGDDDFECTFVEAPRSRSRGLVN